MNKISVVIPSLDRPSLLERTVTRLLQGDTGDFELIVVDQSLDVNPAVMELASRLPRRLRYHSAPGRRGLPYARNVGISLARNEVVLFCDDDVVPAAGIVAAHARCYDESDVGAVAGRVLEPSDSGIASREGSPRGGDRARRPGPGRRVGRVSRVSGNQIDGFDQSEPCEVDHGQGCNISFRKSAIETAGGFDGRFGGSSFLEETDACLRVRKQGYRILFEPSAEVIHLKEAVGGCRPRDPEEWYWWYGHNYMLLLMKNMGWYSWPGVLIFRLATIAAGAWRTRSLRVLGRGLSGMVAGLQTFLRG